MIVLDLVIGVIFVAANFSNSLKHLAGSDEVARLGLARVMTQVSQAPKDVLGASTAALGQWLTVCFLGLWLYLGALAILALARRRLTIIGVGLAGLIAGVLSLAVLSWVGMLLWGVLWLVRRIFHILQTVLQAIGHLLVWLLLYTWPVLTVAAVVTVVVILWKRYGPVRILIGTTCAALLYLLGPVFRAIWEGVLLPVLRWLGRLLGVLFGWWGLALAWVVKVVLVVLAVGMVIGVVGSFGEILVGQMKTAWEAGRSRKGVLVGSFSLGTSLALILLVSTGTPEAQATAVAQSVLLNPPGKIQAQAPSKKKSKKVFRKKSAPVPPIYVPPPPPPIAVTVDQAWHREGWILGNTSLTHIFAVTLPSPVLEWGQTTFRTASAPIFDAAALALAIALSFFGVLRGIFVRKEMPMHIKFHNSDLLSLAVLPLLVILLAMSAHDSDS